VNRLEQAIADIMRNLITQKQISRTKKEGTEKGQKGRGNDECFPKGKSKKKKPK